MRKLAAMLSLLVMIGLGPFLPMRRMSTPQR